MKLILPRIFRNALFLTNQTLLITVPIGGQLLTTPTTLLAAEPGIAAGWKSARAESPLTFKDLSSHNLKLIAGNPYIAYGGDHLYFAQNDGTGWTTVIVDIAWGVGSGAALALDGNGKAHISYYDAVNRDLKYATNKSGNWVTQTVASAGNVGIYSDIAIDGWGDPTIIYFNQTDNELRYTNFDSSIPAWNVNEKIATASAPPHNGCISLALDTSVIPNKPHVIYYPDGYNSVGVARWARYDAGLNWINSPIYSCVGGSPTDCKLGEYNSLALDPVTKRPVAAISWHDNQFSDFVGFLAFNGTSWMPEVVELNTPSYVSLAYDTSGKLHLVWKQNGLKYAYRNGDDDWTAAVTIDSSPTAGEWTSLAVSGTTPKAVHYNTTTGALIYQNHDRSGWLAPYSVANQGHDVGKSSSLAVDRQGRLHISYYDNTDKSLKYVRPVIGAGSWLMNTIDNSGSSSRFSVIAVDLTTDNPIVGFIRGGNLYCRFFSGSIWAVELLVDTAINSTVDYQCFGLAVDSNGRPHFAYRKGNDLWHTYWTGSGWSRTKIVYGLATGRAVALALGPSNQPYIAFYQGSSLWHITYHFLGGWITEQIAASGAGVGAAIAVDRLGNAAVAYLDNVGSNLTFSSRGPICLLIPPYTCTWTTGVVVDSQGEEEFSLAVDRNGKPHMAAMTYPEFRMHYITRHAATWVVQTIDENGFVGGWPSIALSPSGMPRISYYDWTNEDLKFIYQLDRVFLPTARK